MEILNMFIWAYNFKINKIRRSFIILKNVHHSNNISLVIQLASSGKTNHVRQITKELLFNI